MKEELRSLSRQALDLELSFQTGHVDCYISEQGSKGRKIKLTL
jgi:hypothetical protein